MKTERGSMGPIPWASLGEGRPVVVLAGVSPSTGVEGGFMVRSVLSPVLPMARTRRLYALNRWSHLPEGLTMAQLAAEHAAAFREHFDGPVDLVGVSTGGSIAQQVAAEHPDVVRKLVLVSTGCRLEPVARAEQAELAAVLRANRVRQAGALIATDVVPPWAHAPGRAFGRLVAPWVIGGPTARRDLAITLEAEDDFDLSRCSGTISAPTVIFGGAKDRFYSNEVLSETASLIPGANLVLVPGRGHLSVVSDRRTRAGIAAFLSS